MRPDRQSQLLLGVTRSKAKMYEYSVPTEFHIEIRQDPARLFRLTLSILGDLAALINSRDHHDTNEEKITELRETLHFTAKFLDSYLQSKLDESIDQYLLLIGATSYYLCDLPGSASVLVQRINHPIDIDCMGLEQLLYWLLKGDMSSHYEGGNSQFEKFRDIISQQTNNYFNTGEASSSLMESLKELRMAAYKYGSDRQLLIADAVCAVTRKRLENSTWQCLPLYTGIPPDKWFTTINKKTFIREFWPAQHLLGKQGVFKGKSAVVQMPTSAGKTKSTEIIIRSAFLSRRTSMAVVIAPFRALCHEIRASLAESFFGEPVDIDEPSDVMQMDIKISELLDIESRKKILIVTPEKLFYILRQSPELADFIGLLVYDEGHQFDSGTRGITYELLLSSLKSMIAQDAQTILISAVISNAAAIGSWLNGEGSEAVLGGTLSPTYRSLAFSSWQERLGRLYFVDKDNPDLEEFFVPRVIEERALELRGRERKPRIFPDRSDGKSIALYLGINLVHNGAIAIFCGQKTTVTKLCKDAVDKYQRGLNLPTPYEFSDKNEIRKLYFLHALHLGGNDYVTQSSKIGIFAHSGSTPHGLRLAIEHAMREGKAKFVICTSTLAQGVNLPIRYLIVPSFYQAGQKISTRDFHNLIGRAGRAGMHTEGSILFSDPKVYDDRKDNWNRWRWEQAKGLLDPNNAEPCVSKILAIFEPYYSDDKKYYIPMDPLDFTGAYIEGKIDLESTPQSIADAYPNSTFSVDGLKLQIAFKISIISSIESFLMAHWDDAESSLNENVVSTLAKETLAFFLADETQQSLVVDLFIRLAKNIEKNISDPERRKVYGRTLYGVQDLLEIDEWVTKNLDKLIASNDHDELLEEVWPMLAKKISNKNFNKCSMSGALINLASRWINGVSYYELLDELESEGAKLIAGSQTRDFHIEHVVDICENALAYDGMLVIGAIAESATLTLGEDAKSLVKSLQELQKRIKYGLVSLVSIQLHELGFSDRVIAIELSSVITPRFNNKKAIIQEIRNNEERVRGILNRFPSYYLGVLSELLHSDTSQ